MRDAIYIAGTVLVGFAAFALMFWALDLNPILSVAITVAYVIMAIALRRVRGGSAK